MKSLTTVYLKAKVTPEQFVEMMWTDKGAFTAQHDLPRDKRNNILYVLVFVEHYVSKYHRKYGYTSQKYQRLLEKLDASYKSIGLHEDTVATENLIHESTT